METTDEALGSELRMNSNVDTRDRSGGETRPARFVLLRHDWPLPHRDLILEWPGMPKTDRLTTWALYPETDEAEIFSEHRSNSGRAIPLEPHRADYLDYEGPVSGNRGHVRRECAGVVVRARHHAGLTFGIRIENPLGMIEGELRIEAAKPGDMRTEIPIGQNHGESTEKGLVFRWFPTGMIHETRGHQGWRGDREL